MLMRALALAEAGDRITIVDRAKVVGGSWTTPPLVGLDSVECGVHLLENRPRFYALLRRLGVRLERDEMCSMVWRSRRFRMASSRGLFHALVALNAARRGQLDRCSRVAISAMRSIFNIGTGFEYPAAGCRELHERLTQELACHAVRPMLGIEVQRIAVDKAGVRCETSAGVINADRVAIGSRAHAPLFINIREVKSSIEHDRVVSLVLRGFDPERPRYSYVELLHDPHLKRVRDVTQYCAPQVADNEFVLCAQLRASGEQMFAADGTNAIAKYLEDLGFLSAQARLSDSAVNAYEFETITDASLLEVERRGLGRIIAVRTTDFADCFIIWVQRGDRTSPLRKANCKR